MAMEQLYENTVWYSLSFCLKYKRELEINPLYSMEHFKREFALTDKEFAIFFIKSMAETSQWSEISNFLNATKSIFNMIQRQNVRYETIVSIVHYSNGPEEQIKKYLAMIEDLEYKKLLALKLRVYDIVIDVYRQQKDRIGLYMMLTNLKKDSIEYKKANEVLQDDK
ncbi:spermatogenesis-defective 39 -like protein, partial [Brachionus plicatilis]